MRWLLRDLSYSLRVLRRRPGSSTVAILTLALGIGATTAALSVINVAVLRPVPYPNPEELAEISMEVRDQNARVRSISPSIGEMRRWMSDTRVFSKVAAWAFGPTLVVDDGVQFERVRSLHVKLVTEQYFDMLGVRPDVGRGFTTDDMSDGAERVVLLGHGYWKRRFGGDRSVIGRVLNLKGEPTIVVGVLPRTFFQNQRELEEARLDDVQIWLPLRVTGLDMFKRGTSSHVSGRLRSGSDLQAARAELSESTNQLVQEIEGLAPATPELTSFSSLAMQNVNIPNLRVLVTAVSVILLLGCVNVAGLSLAQGASRRDELAVRVSLGADRFQLFRQLLTESFVLSMAAGVVGFGVAYLSLGLLTANMTALVPPNTQATLSFAVLISGVGLTIVVGVMVGWMPAFRLSRAQARRVTSTERTSAALLSRRTAMLLVGIEVALAIVLVTCAGLMLRSLAGVMSVDPGFDPDASLIVEAKPVDEAPGTALRYFPALLQQIGELPEVEAVGAVDRMSGGVANQKASALGRTISVSIRRVVAGYFQALGVPLRQGRLPVASDVAPSASRVVISEEVARQLFPGRSAVGEQVEVGQVAREIVGVVGDVNYAAPYGSAHPEVYLITSQAYSSSLLTVIVRPRDRTTILSERLLKAAQTVAPRAVADRVLTVRERLWSFEAVGIRRQQTSMLGLLAGVALLLAVVGVFGVTQHAAAQRQREMGLRLALGSTPRAAVRLVVGDAMKAAALGAVVGLVATVPASKVVASLLFQTSPWDPVTLAAVSGATGIAVLTAAWLPARRVGRIEPARALRGE